MMPNHNSLEEQERAQASLNNNNLTMPQSELILTVTNLLLKESNINSNNQNVQRDNHVSYENNVNNITDSENQDVSCGICKCLGVIATACCNICLFLFE